MKSFILNRITYAAAVTFSLLASPVLAASHGANEPGVDNIFNYLLGAGSIAFIAIGIWVLYSNMKR